MWARPNPRGNRAADAGELGWRAHGTSERWQRKPGGYLARIEDELDGVSVGSHFLPSFCLFS